MRYITYFLALLLGACCSTEVENTFPQNAVITPMTFLSDEVVADTRTSVKILYIHGMAASEYCGSYEPVKAILEKKWGSVSDDSENCASSPMIDLKLSLIHI